jgi:diguanylate cyclase
MATIAVVDDIAVNRELLVTLLEPRGHSILEAGNGVDALDLAQRNRLDLIICDILMPEVDGYEFVRRLRMMPELHDIPVLFCSAHFLEPEAHDLARACGVEVVLTKPIDADALFRAVDAMLAAGTAVPVPEPVPESGFEHRHLQLIRDKLSEKVAELQQVNEKLEALIELNLQLASERDKKRLVEHVCTGATQVLGADLGTVVTRETGTETIAHVAHCGIDSGTIAAMNTISLDRGVLGRVYRDAHVLCLDTVPEDEDLGLPGGYPQLTGLVAAPVKSLAATYGWICLGKRNGSAVFSDTDAELLGIVAAQAGRIYENGSLYARLCDHTRALEAEIEEHERSQRHLAAQCAVAKILNEAASISAAARILLEAVCTGLGFAAATLWRVDEHGHSLHCTAAWCEPGRGCEVFEAHSLVLKIAPDKGIPGQAWSSGAPVWSSDLDANPAFLRAEVAAEAGLRSGGAIPISVRGEVVAVIDVFSRERCDMDARLGETLSTLGIQIGQFFERTSQHRRIVRLTRVYAVLSGINAAIVRIHDRPQLFAEACRIAVRQGNFGMAWIGEVDSGLAQVVPVAWAGVDDDVGADCLSIEADIATGQGAVGEAVRTGRACIVDHLSDIEGAGKRREEALRRGYQSMIALPLVVEGKVHGVMVLYAEEPEFFTAEEQVLLAELANDVSFALEFIAKQDLLAYMAMHDVLTGLANRAELLDRLDAALHMRRLDGTAVGVVVWDIKRFRNINDTFGRQVGDSLLKELADRFRAAWPYGKGIARIAVDQFACVISGEGELTGIAHQIERTAQGIIGRPVTVGGHELHLSLSGGVAIAGASGEDADSLLKNAEAALRQAKKSGVGYLFYEPDMNALIAKTLLLENRLRQALDRDEFVLHYQPKISGASGVVTGLEALIRWNDPSNGIVLPGTFIPILEDTGMIIQVGAWAIRKALQDARRFRDARIAVARIAVNVSALQLQDNDFVHSIREAVEKWGSEPPLDLEITESMLMTDFKGNVARLDAVRDLGVQIAIDDFGTGYSSLGYLARLPVNALKIDRSFIETMAMTPESMTIVSTIISLAHALNLKVIGEGVENDEQAKFLRLLKCTELQGFLISRPLPFEGIVDFMRSRSH